MIGFGLAGAGGMASVYADRLAGIDGVELRAVASPNTAAAFVADHRPDAEAYGDVERMCAEADLDAVAVLTPTQTHRSVVETAAAYGLDVICEKPLARTIEEAEAVADVVAESGITFMTAHVVRFFPEYAEAKRRVDAGEIGEPGVVRTRRAFGFAGDRGWFEDRAKSGGITHDLAIHDFDYLRWVFGDVERVFTRSCEWSASGDREADGKSEVSLSLVRFESGAVGHVEAWAVETPTVPFTTAFEFAGDEGLLEYDNDQKPVAVYTRDDVEVPRDPVSDELPLARDGYRRQLDHFLECVETGRTPSVSVEAGIESMRVSLAALESARRGVPVAPSEVPVDPEEVDA